MKFLKSSKFEEKVLGFFFCCNSLFVMGEICSFSKDAKHPISHLIRSFLVDRRSKGFWKALAKHKSIRNRAQHNLS
jgi:hypothetical protein